MKTKHKHVISLILAAVFLFTITGTAFAAPKTKATTLRLEQTEGTSVTLNNKNGKELSIINGMKLYSGNQLTTGLASYAYLSLDDTKAVKMDANSKGEVKQSGKKLEFNLTAGQIYLNVTAPLQSAETLNIRTSTMVTGVRGTIMIVNAGEEVTEVLMVSGSANVSGPGGSLTLTAGQSGTIPDDPTAPPTAGTFGTGDIPGFAAGEIANDPNAQQQINDEGVLDVDEIVSGAEEKKQNDEKEAEEKSQQTPSSGTDPVVVPATAPAPAPGGGSVRGSNSPSPPTPETEQPSDETILSGTDGFVSVADLETALAQYNTITFAARVTAIEAGGVTVPADKTVTFPANATTTIGVGKTFTITGTVVNKGKIENGGTIMIGSPDDPKGTMTNEGTIINNGSIINNSPDTFTNTSSGTIEGNTEIDESETPEEEEPTASVIYNEAGGTMTLGGTVNAACIYNTGTLEINGTVTVGLIVNGEGETATAKMSINGGSVTSTLTIPEPDDEYEYEYEDVAAITNMGTLIIDGGSVTSTASCAIFNIGTLAINSGTFIAPITAEDPIYDYNPLAYYDDDYDYYGSGAVAYSQIWNTSDTTLKVYAQYDKDNKKIDTLSGAEIGGSNAENVFFTLRKSCTITEGLTFTASGYIEIEGFEDEDGYNNFTQLTYKGVGTAVMISEGAESVYLNNISIRTTAAGATCYSAPDGVTTEYSGTVTFNGVPQGV